MPSFRITRAVAHDVAWRCLRGADRWSCRVASQRSSSARGGLLYLGRRSRRSVAIAVDPRRALQDWVHAADVRVLKPVIDATSSFAKFREACAHLKHGAFGKLVVKVRNQ